MTKTQIVWNLVERLLNTEDQLRASQKDLLATLEVKARLMAENAQLQHDLRNARSELHQAVAQFQADR